MLRPKMPGPNHLVALVGHMKVEQLARFAGIEVEALVHVVLGAPSTRSAPSGHNGTSRSTTALVTERSNGRAAARSVARTSTGTDEPPLAAMFGRLTHHELHRVVDRWLLGRVLREESDNVSHAAKRLGISRRTLREHRDRALDPGVDAWMSDAPPHEASPDVPPPPSLTTVLEGGGSYRDVRKVVDRWLIGGTLAREQNNVTWAARSLGMSRKDLRARWARVRD
jgi:DNA-binding NtrC family response regulator